MKYYLFFLLSFCIKSALSQNIYFPAIGDGAPDPKAKFGYLESVPVEIHADSFDTLYCDNGFIKIKSRKSYDFNIIDYKIIPNKIGPLTVTLVSSKDGFSDTTRSTISIVKRPILRLVVHKTDSLFKLNLIDENDQIVTDQFYCAMEIGFINDVNFKTVMSISDWKNGLTIDDIISKKLKAKLGLRGLIFNTTAVYSRDYGLYTGSYSCSIKLKN
jgi:hypothetical protein